MGSILRLPSGESPETMQRWFDQIVVKIDEMGFAPPPPSELVGGMDDDELTEHDHPPWYKWPTDGSATSKFLHICTFPIKGMVFTTTPNVLIKKNEKWYRIDYSAFIAAVVQTLPFVFFFATLRKVSK